MDETILDKRYRLTAYYYPNNSRNFLTQLRKCFLGVSLENSRFTDTRLISMLTWIARRCDYCSILVGDSIHRKTLQIHSDIDERSALLQALGLGRQFINNASNLLQQQTYACSFNFVTCEEIQHIDTYPQYHEKIRIEFNTNELFKKSIEEFSQEYIKRKAINTNNLSANKMITLSCEYFLEEFAVFSCLSAQGFKVMIYPGSFSSLRSIVEGTFPRLSPIFPKGLISLKFKRK